MNSKFKFSIWSLVISILLFCGIVVYVAYGPTPEDDQGKAFLGFLLFITLSLIGISLLTVFSWILHLYLENKIRELRDEDNERPCRTQELADTD